jgi:hypothetical protein
MVEPRGIEDTHNKEGGCLLIRVCELIDTEIGGWDEPLVRSIFVEQDVKVILTTHINDEYIDFPCVKGQLQ